jgi:hypothetical protein
MAARFGIAAAVGAMLLLAILALVYQVYFSR